MKESIEGRKRPFFFECCGRVAVFVAVLLCSAAPVFAAEDMWTAANRIIVDVYNNIAGISTVLAGLMSAVAVIGAKLSNNQHRSSNSFNSLRAFTAISPRFTS
jgi:hypothetical protein